MDKYMAVLANGAPVLIVAAISISAAGKLITSRLSKYPIFRKAWENDGSMIVKKDD